MVENVTAVLLPCFHHVVVHV